MPQGSKFDARLDRKFVSSAFFGHEIEEEFRERKMTWCFKGSDYEAIEAAFSAINDFRAGKIYSHEEANCSALCKEKGIFFLVNSYPSPCY